MYNIRLTNTDSINADNKEMSVEVNLQGTSKGVKYNSIRKTIDAYEVYQNERNKCERYRLILTVNPFCSNVLFNPLTEIAKYTVTDGGGVRIERVIDSTKVNGIDGSGTSKRVQYIANTMYSNDFYGYTYYPGYDIFDNHILRSKEFNVVTHLKANNGRNMSYFNTISDFARNSKGDVIKTIKRNSGAKAKPSEVKKHIYNNETLLSFEDSINLNLSEEDGWLGFPNVTKLVTYNNENEAANWCRVLNNHSASEFIQMYPDRSSYSFTPVYNNNMNRLEYNWDILITYPYENFDEHELVRFGNINALKLYSGKIQTGLSNEQIIMFRSCTKHNLIKNNYVHLMWRFTHCISEQEYNSLDEIEKNNCKPIVDSKNKIQYYLKTDYVNQDEIYRVANVGDLKNDDIDYYFYVDDKSLIDSINNSIEGKTTKLNCQDESCNVKIKDITFYMQKITNGSPSKYYFRKFKKLELEGQPLVKEQYDLGFATTIYNDGVTQITFTDNIDFTDITDNMGRPISEFFITFLKTNRGNKEWYEEEKANITGSAAEKVENSHCFSKLTDGLDLHYESNDFNEDNAEGQKQKNLCNIRFIGGKNQKWLSENKITFDTETIDRLGVDWVNWHGITKEQDWFYGDVVEFITNEYKEYVIADVNYRFNTYQRENLIGDKKIIYHNIKTDDYDYNVDFTIEAKEAEQFIGDRDEGYFYKPHYPIRIKEEGEVEQGGHYTIRIRNAEVVQYDDVFIKVISLQTSNLREGDIILLMDDKNGINFRFKVSYITSKTTFFICPVNGWFGEDGFINQSKEVYQKALTWSDIVEHLRRGQEMFLRRYNENIPSYAVLAGRNTFLWRNLYNSGEKEISELPEYVFTNNAFYVTPIINFYLKRQDPNGFFGLYRIDKQNPQDPAGENKKPSNYEYKDPETTSTC